MIKIYLKPGKEEPVRRFHPWIFSGAIARIDGSPADGDVVQVLAKNGDLLGAGHFHHGSIAVRLLTFSDADVMALPFWTDAFKAAWRVREKALPLTAETAETALDCFRLVHGEGDGLSGLIVDVYGETAVLQCHSIGMHRQRELLTEALHAALPDRVKAIYDKSVETLPVKYAGLQQNGYLWSENETPEGSAIVTENGVRFKVDWVGGQKTGFFLDQRDNRQLLAHFVKGKSVLNAFCYTGGFSAYALKAGARKVHSVDISAKAMDLTAANVALNLPYLGTHEGFTEDVLPFLKAEGEAYEVLIIDPPAYAKSLDKRHNAVQGYKRLNEAALRRAAPGAIVFTFSCSQVVDRELFYHTIAAAAMEVKRPVRVLHHLTQGADHPVSLFHPEGAYLKGLVLYVE